ncbi:MAG: PEP-CTERM sorting domain-containing protein, partial [Pirellulales bacterium]
DDIDVFVLGLTQPPDYESLFGVRPNIEGDIDMDGDQDFDDISGFVAILVGPGLQSIPEPSTLVLFFVGLIAYGLGWRRRYLGD